MLRNNGVDTMSEIAWIKENGELAVSYDDRPKFIKETKELFSKKTVTQHICHFISWDMIAQLTELTVNSADTNMVKQQKLQALLGVMSSGEVPADVSVTQCATVMRKCEKNCQDAINKAFGSGKRVDPTQISIFLKYLNSVPYNLRLGDQIWNSSINKRADPRGFAHVNGSGQVDCRQGKQELRVNMTQGSFTLTSRADERQLSAMDTAFSDYSIFFLTATDLSDNVSFVYSSMNSFSIPTNVGECEDVIYRGS